MDNLFVGNIVQRTWKEVKGSGIKATGKIINYRLKENTILYKTQNGGYVDIENLDKKRDYNSVEKVVLEDGAENSKKGILVMPAASLSKAIEETEKQGTDGVLGIFVDLDSLKSYNSYENEKNIDKLYEEKKIEKNK